MRVTVAAIGILSENPRMYGALPFLVSGTCKREDAKTHANLIETIIKACKNDKSKIGCSLMFIASDSESCRGSALIQITQKHTLSPSSKIYPLLHGLRFLNLLVGDSDITADKDYKHVVKWLRNLLLRKQGTIVHGVHITPSLLQFHLKLAGVSESRLTYLFNPNDRQDVPLAYTLLKEIWSLPEPQSTDNPNIVSSQHAICVLGQLFKYIVLPYIQTTLSLHEQLTYLSAAAHLTFFLYTHNHTSSAFIPSQTYFDIMLMIKNAYFCVSKAKVWTPGDKFYLVLMGTDRLEGAFSVSHTMNGTDHNCDVYQLANHLANIAECAIILAEHRKWDRGPRHLKLQAIEDENGDISGKMDHINLASWKGDVHVSNVLPITSWNLGRQQVEHKFATLNVAQALHSLELRQDVDMAFPFGGGFRPWEDDLEEADEGDSSDVAPTTGQIADSSLDALRETISDEMDLEDHMAVQSSEKYSPYVELNGKKIHKAKVLRQFFKYSTSPGSMDRLKCVAGLSRFTLSNVASDSSTITDHDESILGDNCLCIGDPAIMLMQCSNQIFLAVIHVSEILCDSRPTFKISRDVFMEPIIEIHFQILHLTELAMESHSQSTSNDMPDWMWSG
ncbi:hypothetical protein AX14_004851 [Amanita brunnescens Koide BX004]|nr:hypothetical protein AX14_004851 [Amanita brunnescens Koide BX004]